MAVSMADVRDAIQGASWHRFGTDGVAMKDTFIRRYAQKMSGEISFQDLNDVHPMCVGSVGHESTALLCGILNNVWSAETALPVNSLGGGAAGTVYRMLVAAGHAGSAVSNAAYKFQSNSSSLPAWTSTTNIPHTSYFVGMSGTMDNALIAGGRYGSGSMHDATNSFNGSSWTTLANTDVIAYMGYKVVGVPTDALIWGYSALHKFNGTAVTRAGTNTNRSYRGGSAGSPNNALSYGGMTSSSGTNTSLAHSFNGTTLTTSTSLPSVWAKGSQTGGAKGSAMAASGAWNNATASNSYWWSNSAWIAKASALHALTSCTSTGNPAEFALIGGYTSTFVNHYQRYQ
jgi:hypothetical protein